MIKHKHEREIIAWANGAEIEYKFKMEEGWDYRPSPIWSDTSRYRVKPDCEYAFGIMKVLGVLDLYVFWLNGEEVTAEHPVCKSSLLKASDHEDPFHYFLECAKGHKLSKKVVKVKQALWVWYSEVTEKTGHTWLAEDEDFRQNRLCYTAHKVPTITREVEK